MIIVIATIHFKAEFIEEGKAILEALQIPTKKEQGCIQYDLHQNLTNPCEFVFYERWESMEYLNLHAATQHIEAFKKDTQPMLANESKVAIYHLV